MAFPPPPSPTHYDVVHDVGAQIEYSRQGTGFYPHYCEALANWRTRDREAEIYPFNTVIEFTKSTTLTAAHRLSHAAGSPAVSPTLSAFRPPTRIGVLSFASAKKAGGGFLAGADDQEARIARSSSLIANLESDTATQFYAEHRRLDDGSGLHDHSMLYSPGVVVLRAQDDEIFDTTEHLAGFVAPYRVNVLSAVPVNAAAIRSKYTITPSDEPIFAAGIESAMRERMARALHVFRLHRNTKIVLGAFGEGSSEVPPALVGRLWAELLVCGDGEHPAEFAGLFDNVVFAVSGRAHKEFREAFEQRCLEVELEGALRE